MALDEVTTTIQGVEYKITKLPFSRGKAVLLRLTRAVGPAIAAALGGVPDIQGKSLGELSMAEVAPSLVQAARRLAEDLSEPDFDFIVDTLMPHAWIMRDGKQIPLSREKEFHFSGNYLAFFQWLGWALKVNFMGFSDGRDLFGEVVAKAQAASMAQRSRSPNGSTGPCTE